MYIGFDKGEAALIPVGRFANTNQSLSLYGYKLVAIEKEFVWEVASKEDYLTSESIRLGVDKSIVKDKSLDSSCGNVRPQECSIDCNQYPFGWCKLFYNPSPNPHYYCLCNSTP